MRADRIGACAVLVAAVVLGVPSVAAADPAPEPCLVDGTRGAVPDGFVLDACVEAGAITLRNPLDVPVAVRVSGDLGAPERRVTAGGASAVVGRGSAAAPVLAPGDVVRWSRGPGAGELVVDVLDRAVSLPVMAELEPLAPRLAGHQDLTGLVAVVGSAVAARTDCIEGRSVIERVACDLRAADAIGSAVAVQVPVDAVPAVVDRVLDPVRWDAWVVAAAEAAPQVDAGQRLLVQTEAPPLPVVEPAPGPAPGPARAPGTAPAPGPGRKVPAPSPAPSPAPRPLPVPMPVPLPAPAPLPAPLPVPLPAPPRVDLREEAERWLREMAEQAERAREAAREEQKQNSKDRGGRGGR
jgi:hypothetical protein